MYSDLIELMEGSDMVIYRSRACTSDEVRMASSLLDLKLPEDFVSYLETFGSLSFGSFEINGIIDNTDLKEPVNSNFVGLTLEAYEKYHLPKKYALIGSVGDGSQYALCCDSNSRSFGKLFYWNAGVRNAESMEAAFDSFYEFVKYKIELVLD